MPVPGGYSWRSDSRLTLPSPVRLSEAQAMAHVRRVSCPALLVVAADGMLARHAALLEQLPFEQVTLPGGHHLHLNDEQGAALVAELYQSLLWLCLTCTGQVSRLGGLNRETTMQLPDILELHFGAARRLVRQ